MVSFQVQMFMNLSIFVVAEQYTWIYLGKHLKLNMLYH